MDALGGGLGNVDISKLSDRDKQELQQFVMNESQKARIQSCMSSKTSLPYSRRKDMRLTSAAAIHSLTDTCFRKCIPAGNVKNGKLDKYEEPCMRQCVDRFLDANYVVMKELERLRQ
jgi:import inner membrane translocase subunit TIM8